MIFLDFEASAPTGFAVEVGICRVNADRSLTSAGKLIRHDEWLDEFQRWDWQAEQIHHITRANLMAHGESPAVVMAWLNDQLRGQVACADSPSDLIWCQELAAAAGIAMEFAIVDIGVAFEGAEIDEVKYDRLARMVSSPVAYGREHGHQFGQSGRLGLEPKTHRAEQDSRHLASWYTASLKDDAAVHRLLVKRDGGTLRVPLGQALTQDQIDGVLGNVVGNTMVLPEAERLAGNLGLEDILSTIRRIL